MKQVEDLASRHAALQQRIEAARLRLAERQDMEWAEIGTLLEGLSRDMDGDDDAELDARAARYDRMDRDLDGVQSRLDDAPSKP